jgi:DNA repair exonuclease SbcCD ATPase subunit
VRNIEFRQFGIKNFLSIGDEPVEINFTSGIHLITGHNADRDGRRNGVGKSTVMDAFHWVIFGSPIRDINKGTIANFNSKGKCTGWLEFDITLDGKKNTYKITRQLAPAKCELLVNGEDKTLSTVAQTTALIEKLLGFSSILFRNSAILSINASQPFLGQDKVVKRKFIEGVFNLEVFSNILADVRTKSLDIKKQIDITFTKLDAKQQNIKVYSAQRDLFVTETAKRLESVDKQIATLNEKKAELERKIVDVAQFEKRKELIRLKRNEIQSAIVKNDEKSLAVKEDILKLKQQIDDVKREKIEYEKKAALNSELRVKLEKLGVPEDVSVLNDKLKKLTATKTQIETILTQTREGMSEAMKNVWKEKQVIDDILKEKKAYIDSTKQNICPTCKRPYEQKVVFEEAKAAEFDSRIEKQKQVVIDTEKNIADTFAVKIKECEEARTKLETNVLTITKAIGTAEKLISERASYEKQIAECVEKIIGTDPVTFDKRVAGYESIINEHLQKIENYKNANEQLKTDGLNKIDIELEKLNATITENERFKTEANSTVSQITSLQKSRDDITKEKNPFVEMLDQAEKDKIVIETEWNDQRKLHAVYESAKFIVSEEGVKTFIIKKLLNALNDRIQYYLKKLDAPCTCVFNEFFEETIKNDRGVECSYYNFSGAEMKSIDLACLFAFMDIRRMQGDVAINISMYDELFDSSFDERGMDHIIEILRERVAKNNEAIFVISHRKESLKAVTGEVIYLEKRNGLTKRLKGTNEISSS